jgi:hypothetical protein
MRDLGRQRSGRRPNTLMAFQNVHIRLRATGLSSDRRHTNSGVNVQPACSRACCACAELRSAPASRTVGSLNGYRQLPHQLEIPGETRTGAPARTARTRLTSLFASHQVAHACGTVALAVLLRVCEVKHLAGPVESLPALDGQGDLSVENQCPGFEGVGMGVEGSCRAFDDDQLVEPWLRSSAENSSAVMRNRAWCERRNRPQSKPRHRRYHRERARQRPLPVRRSQSVLVETAASPVSPESLLFLKMRNG